MPREKPLLVSFSISFFFVVKFLRFCTFSHVVTASEHKEFRRPAFPSAIIAMSRILKGKTSWVKSHYLGQKFQIHGLFLWKLWYMDLIGRTRSNAGAWNVCNNWKMSIPLWRTSSKLYSRWVYTKEKNHLISDWTDRLLGLTTFFCCFFCFPISLVIAWATIIRSWWVDANRMRGSEAIICS